MNKTKRLPSVIPSIQKHLERTAKIEWEQVLKDPRNTNYSTWCFGYLMQMLFYGVIGGCKSLRDVENLSEKYDERIPDTTLHDLIVKVQAQPISDLLVKEVKKSLRDHELPQEEFPVRVTAIDGKSAYVSSIEAGDYSLPSESNGKKYYINRTLRAYHVSNSTKLCIGQRQICGKKAETSEFQPFIEQLIQDYDKTSLLEVISIDAGMISKSNADYLINQGLDYIMALKNPQKYLLINAKCLLGSGVAPVKETEETSHGRTVVRKFYRCIPEEIDKNEWNHIQEFWRIVQTTTHDKSEKVEEEERYFVSSLAPETLNNTQAMKAIRMHWEIENTGNWIADVAWQEDDSPFASRALELITLLRMLAFNIISRLMTRKIRKADERRLTWARLMNLVEHSLFELRYSDNFKDTLYQPFVFA